MAWAAYLATAGAPAEIMVEPRLEAIEDCVERAPAGALWCGEVTAELAAARDAAREGDADVAACG